MNDVANADDHLLSTLAGALAAGHWNPLDWHWQEAVTVARIVGQLPAQSVEPDVLQHGADAAGLEHPLDLVGLIGWDRFDLI